jgi:adenylate cyclase
VSGPGGGSGWLADLEVQLLGPARYTRQEILAAAGVSQQRADRLWRAMGFPDAQDDTVFFTDRDLEALRQTDRLISAGLLRPEEAEAVTRAVAQAQSRLADWQVGTLRRLAESLPGGADPEQIVELVGGVLPVLEDVQAYVWRRHLAAAASRLLAGDTDPRIPAGGEPGRSEVVGFADMVGFTRATRRMSRDELATVLECFEATTSEVIVEGRGRIVKTVGDEVLFAADDPVVAAEIALRLVAAFRDEPVLPELRVGMAAGQVLSRYGDVFGEVVNIASRLTTHARPGSVLVDKELATALADDRRYELRSLPAMTVRGYRHLQPWLLRRADDAPAQGS